MPATGMNVIITGLTTQTVKYVDGHSVLDFYVEEKIGERESSDFWLEHPVVITTNNSTRASKANRSTWQTTQKASRRGCTTLSRMGATATQRSQSLQDALEANKIPRMTCQEIQKSMIRIIRVTDQNYKFL
ncbi:hypothetical protein F8M41_002080 [Gigaspora margarita]|uniref:Uncharacterized protein n=1 Tax=Gigaspora margarita TaxID=4874 RepID=A0A8H3XFD4_GIGMA|nr:hypothetical protein F8M41_002080 [Gigaspora margarita]